MQNLESIMGWGHMYSSISQNYKSIIMSLLQKFLFKLMSSRVFEKNRAHHCINFHSDAKSNTNELLSIKCIKNTKLLVKEPNHRVNTQSEIQTLYRSENR